MRKIIRECTLVKLVSPCSYPASLQFHHANQSAFSSHISQPSWLKYRLFSFHTLTTCSQYPNRLSLDKSSKLQR